MKKVTSLCFILFIITISISADEVVWGSMYSEGNINLGGDAAFEVSGAGYQIAIYPALEMLFLKPVIADFGFIDVGATAKGRIGIPLSLGTGLSAGVGVLGTVHFGFRGLDIPGSEYLERMDLFAEAGLKFDILQAIAGDSFGFTAASGVNYFLDDGFTVGAAYTNWGGFNGGGVSVFIKLGEKPAFKGLGVDWQKGAQTFAVQPYLLQFYTLFYSVHFAGGFYPDEYKEGMGTVHQVSIIDDDGQDSFLVEKALLKKFPDDKMLWKMEYRDDEDLVYYEYITDSDYVVETVYFESEDDGILELPADEEYAGHRYMNWDDYGADVRRNVKIDVEAGSFKTDEYSYEDETDVRVNWWLTDKVPGLLVSYKFEDSSEIVISELFEITKNNKARLYK
jgi:hypothetical protein